MRSSHATCRWRRAGSATRRSRRSPQLVKTMRVKPPTGQGQVRLIDVEGVDLQPCGGTHVARTGEIGPVVVRKIESKGRHNRRVTLAFGEAP